MVISHRGGSLPSVPLSGGVKLLPDASHHWGLCDGVKGGLSNTQPCMPQTGTAKALEWIPLEIEKQWDWIGPNEAGTRSSDLSLC